MNGARVCDRFSFEMCLFSIVPRLCRRSPIRILSAPPSPFLGFVGDGRPDAQRAVTIPVMCSDVVVYPYQIYQARLAGADALKLIAPALPAKVSRVLRADFFMPLYRLACICRVT